MAIFLTWIKCTKMNSTDEQIEKFQNKKNIYLLLTLFILRNKQQAYFPKTSSEITELMDLLQHTHDYSEYFTSFQWVALVKRQKQREPTLIIFSIVFQIKSLFDKNRRLVFIFHKQKPYLSTSRSIDDLLNSTVSSQPFRK